MRSGDGAVGLGSRCGARLAAPAAMASVYIAGHDAAMGAGRGDKVEIDSPLAGQPPRQRRDHRAAGQPRRSIIALRRADFTERVEHDRPRRCRCSRHG